MPTPRQLTAEASVYQRRRSPYSCSRSSRRPSEGWSSARSIAGFLVAAALLVGFVAWERRSRAPMLDVSLFRNPRFSAACGAVTVSFFTLLGFIFVITQYFQLIKHYDPLSAGVHLLPVAVSVGVASVVGTKLAVRVGTKLVVTAGLLMVTAFYLWVATVSTSTGYATIAAQMVLYGIGMGLTSAPATEAIMGVVPVDKAGVGSAVNDATRLLGGTLGVAVIGSVYASVYASRLTATLPARAPARSRVDRPLFGRRRVRSLRPTRGERTRLAREPRARGRGRGTRARPERRVPGRRCSRCRRRRRVQRCCCPRSHRRSKLTSLPTGPPGARPRPLSPTRETKPTGTDPTAVKGGDMETIETLKERNKHFAAHEFRRGLAMMPALKTMIIGCADPRVDPADVLGLELGDAALIRNIGGRITPATLQTMAMLRLVATAKRGGAARSGLESDRPSSHRLWHQPPDRLPRSARGTFRDRQGRARLQAHLRPVGLRRHGRRGTQSKPIPPRRAHRLGPRV